MSNPSTPLTIPSSATPTAWVPCVPSPPSTYSAHPFHDPAVFVFILLSCPCSFKHPLLPSPTYPAPTPRMVALLSPCESYQCPCDLHASYTNLSFFFFSLPLSLLPPQNSDSCILLYLLLLIYCPFCSLSFVNPFLCSLVW